MQSCDVVRTPLVSVIMPTYQCEATLPYAIESVLAQTHSDLELVVVDDASTDRTPVLLEHYRRMDPRVRTTRNEHNSRKGPVEWEPRNDGLKLATGRFIAYLDADNEWHPDFVDRMVSYLRADDDLQLVHCDSRNHYSAAECARAVAVDHRALVERTETSTVFSNDELDETKLGREQYIDTNEMMHRSSIFRALLGLWRTRHPRRDEINKYQGGRCPYRRHNDLDLFERVLAQFGRRAVRHVRETLVEYFYPSFQRPPHPALSHVAWPSPLATEVQSRLVDMHVERFQGANPGPRGASVAVDFGVGEIELGRALDMPSRYREFILSGGERHLASYNDEAAQREASASIASYLGQALASSFSVEQVVAFDGCQDAIGHAVSMFCTTRGVGLAGEGVAFAVPSYPYWTIAAAGRHTAVPIEAYDADTFCSALDACSADRIGAVVLASPNNPLGYALSPAHIQRVDALARERNWGVVADLAYVHFLDSGHLEAIAALDPARTVFCFGWSKSWALPGLRLGYAVARDPRLLSTLKALKHARSHQPSGVTRAFAGWLAGTDPRAPWRIAEAIRTRRERLRAVLIGNDLEGIGVELPPVTYPGLYEVLYLDEYCRRTRMSTQELAARWATRNGVRVRACNSYYPPSGRFARREFVRLSVGLIDNVEAGAVALVDALRGDVASA